MTDMARAAVRGKLTEWRRQRKEQSEIDAGAAAGLFERAEADGISRAATRTIDECQETLREALRIYEQANKHADAAGEHQKDALRSSLEYNAMTPRGPNGRRAAAAAARTVAEAWDAAAREATIEKDLFKAAGREYWKAVAATSEVAHIGDVSVATATRYLNDARGNDRKAAAVRLKAAQKFDKDLKEYADARTAAIYIEIDKSEEAWARTEGWAVAAAVMAAEWEAVAEADEMAVAEADTRGRTAV